MRLKTYAKQIAKLAKHNPNAQVVFMTYGVKDYNMRYHVMLLPDLIHRCKITGEIIHNAGRLKLKPNTVCIN